MKAKKSFGVDGISTYFLKHFAPEICKPLAFAINKSISTGSVPSLKTAKIVPVFKANDPSLY